MTIEEYQNDFSDFHKEAYGFRPRFSTSHWTLADWEHEWEVLRRALDQRIADEAESEAAAVVEFEARIVKLIDMGAADRETAIRWIADAEGAAEDSGYLCYLLGLPYGFFAKTPTCVV